MKQKDILTILIPTFIISVLWVLFSIYHSLTTSTIKSPLDIQIIPISGTFDLNTISQIKNRQKVTPEYNAVVQETDLEASPTPSITPSEDEVIAEDEITEEDVDPTPSITDEEVILEDEVIEE